MSESLHDFKCKTIDGDEENLANYKDKVVLVVNTASNCGFTPQYKGLEKIYKEYKDQGFEILGFPCNQFGNQEPGSSEQIADFCTTKFDVSFPMFDKIEVNGPGTDPVYQYLKKAAPGVLGSKSIKWNFTKFLVGKDGKAIKRYGSKDKPEAIGADIKSALV